MARNGQLKVWWNPQVPMEPFEVFVETLEEAHLLLKVLADYDLFQYRHRVKPDYSNAGGLVVWEEGLEPDEEGEKWTDWEGELGETFEEYCAKQGWDERRAYYNG